MPASNNPTLAGGKIPALYPQTHQKVAYTGTAGTLATAVTSSVVRVVLTTNGYIKISAAGTAATVNDTYMAANSAEYFRCNPGDKVSAIQDATGGNLHVTEMD